jgi:nitrate reductase NapE component
MTMQYPMARQFPEGPPTAVKPAKKRWLLLLLIPTGLFTAVAVAGVGFFVWSKAMAEKSPGYALSTRVLESHAGVAAELGSPVKVVKMKGWILKATPSGKAMELTFDVQGSLSKGNAVVQSNDFSGAWQVEGATIETEHGGFGLLANGELQPLYAPKSSLLTAR